MQHIFGAAILLVCAGALNINETYNYFKYSGPELTLAQNLSFTQFYVLNDTEVFSVKNELNLQSGYFPKCCPPQYKYQTTERKCVKSNESAVFEMLPFTVNLIKSGLKECDVIVDDVVSLNDTNNLIGDSGILKYKNETFPLGKYCIDGILNEETQGILRVCYDGGYCSRRGGLRCFKKCCRDGEIYIGRNCRSQPEHGFLIEPHRKFIVNATDNFAIFTPRRSCELHLPNISNDDVINVFENGSLTTRIKGTWKTYSVNDEMYCFELSLSNPVQPYMLMCVDTSDRNSIKFMLSKVVMTLSCCCFILTMAVYVFLYKLEKIVHRIVFCYCLAQFTGFAALTYLQIEPHQAKHCKTLALIVLFGFLAGFAWLNVMCYDMWRTLGSMEAKVGDMKKASMKKIVYYSIYAWSLPIVITLTCYYEHTYSLFPEYLHAHIGEYYCILEQKVKDGNFGHTLFFILPITILTVANTIFFGLTVRYILQATDHIRKMSDTSQKKKKRLLFALKKKTFMTLKLFLVMGINWSFEIISSVINFSEYSVTKYIEIIWDTFNCFQGVFVFLIFVLKWKTIKPLLVKLKVIVISSVSRSTSEERSSN